MPKRFIGISRNFSLFASGDDIGNQNLLRRLVAVAKSTRGIVKAQVAGSVTGQVMLSGEQMETLTQAAQLTGGEIFVGTEDMDPWKPWDESGRKIAEDGLEDAILALDPNALAFFAHAGADSKDTEVGFERQ